MGLFLMNTGYQIRAFAVRSQNCLMTLMTRFQSESRCSEYAGSTKYRSADKPDMIASIGMREPFQFAQLPSDLGRRVKQFEIALDFSSRKKLFHELP